MAKWRDEKKRYKRYKVRKEQLPARCHEAIDAVQLTEDFLKSYPASPWAANEQQRLAHNIHHAARAEV